MEGGSDGFGRADEAVFQVAAVALVLMGVTSGVFFRQVIETIRHQKRMANQEEIQNFPT